MTLPRTNRFGETRSLIFALITGVFIAFYTLVDGMGVRLAGATIGYVTSVLMAALIGTVFLGEASRGVRLSAAACVAAGNLLLQLR